MIARPDRHRLSGTDAARLHLRRARIFADAARRPGRGPDSSRSPPATRCACAGARLRDRGCCTRLWHLAAMTNSRLSMPSARPPIGRPWHDDDEHAHDCNVVYCRDAAAWERKAERPEATSRIDAVAIELARTASSDHDEVAQIGCQAEWSPHPQARRGCCRPRLLC